MMKRDNKVGCLTAIYDVQMLGRKFFMPTIRKRQDWALFLQIIRECKVCYAYPEKPLAYYCMQKEFYFQQQNVADEIQYCSL